MTRRRAVRATGLALIACVALLPRIAFAANVAIRDNEFAPQQVTITMDADVDWRYAVGDGTALHTVTADDGSFDSGNLTPGDTFSHTFTEAGTFGYYCKVHGAPGGEGMAGTVKVEHPDHHHATTSATPTQTSSTKATSTSTTSTTTSTTSARPTTSARATISATAKRTMRAKPRASNSPTTIAAAPIADRGQPSGNGPTIAAALLLIGAIFARMRFGARRV